MHTDGLRPSFLDFGRGAAQEARALRAPRRIEVASTFAAANRKARCVMTPILLTRPASVSTVARSAAFGAAAAREISSQLPPLAASLPPLHRPHAACGRIHCPPRDTARGATALRGGGRGRSRLHAPRPPPARPPATRSAGQQRTRRRIAAASRSSGRRTRPRCWGRLTTRRSASGALG